MTKSKGHCPRCNSTSLAKQHHTVIYTIFDKDGNYTLDFSDFVPKRDLEEDTDNTLWCQKCGEEVWESDVVIK